MALEKELHKKGRGTRTKEQLGPCVCAVEEGNFLSPSSPQVEIYFAYDYSSADAKKASSKLCQSQPPTLIQLIFWKVVFR